MSLKHRWNTGAARARALRPRGSALAGAGAALLSSLTPLTGAAAEGQWQLGARAGVAWLGAARGGPSAEAFLRHGLTDSVELDVQVLTSLHPFQPDAKMPASASSAGVPWVAALAPGLVYRWDVLRLIPFAGAAVGLMVGDGFEAGDAVSRWNGVQFGASVRGGLEYLMSREVILSAQASAHVALTESPLPAPWFQLGAGAGFVWGW